VFRIPPEQAWRWARLRTPPPVDPSDVVVDGLMGGTRTGPTGIAVPGWENGFSCANIGPLTERASVVVTKAARVRFI